MGKTDEAIERAQRAQRLSPFDSMNYLSNNALAISYFLAGRHQDAHEAARRSVQINPRFSVCHLFLTVGLAGLGRIEEAKAEGQRALALDPGFSISRFAVTAGFEPKVFTRLADAWRAAGLPD